MLSIASCIDVFSNYHFLYVATWLCFTHNNQFTIGIPPTPLPLSYSLIDHIQQSQAASPLVLGGESLSILKTLTVDRDQTVSRRFKPSSRTTFMGEQPNPWNLLQPQDVMSRHRGAKRFRQYGLLRIISLLSPTYLLSVVR